MALRQSGSKWEVCDGKGRVLTRLSRNFSPPDGVVFLRGEVAAVLLRRKQDGDEDFHHLIRRDEWGVVLPELVFSMVD